LARIWSASSDRLRVTRAQAQIDATLARGALHQAVHHSEGLYSLTVSPLMAFFTIDNTKRLIVVSWVKLAP
jgi:hypothetical protein